MILPFKDRLLFFGPVIQSSSGVPIYLQDTVIYSQDGTPYYTASFTGDVSSANTTFNPILTPLTSSATTQTASPNSYFNDQTGYGGYLEAGYSQPITTVNPNEDVLLVGFTTRQSRLVFSGNDILPFDFYNINSELGSSATFSSITLDRGAVTVGPNGIILTSQTQVNRIDLQIPDEVFQFNLSNNGTQRICAQRDFINEWIYFTYPSNEISYKYPNQSLLYNYRDNSWGIFEESYTTYGSFRRQTGYTWATLPHALRWNTWTTPWNAGDTTLLQPEVIAGNQQGFVLFRDSEGTGESTSLSIQNISGITVTSPNHNLNEGDYIVIMGCMGVTGVNGNIYSVSEPTTNTFLILGPSGASGTYIGGGLIQKMYVPYVQTKQFPLAWEMGRKTRIGPQQYLLSTTNLGQITLLIFLSTNSAEAYNEGNIVPEPNTVNNALVYSTVLYTCPELQNIGLTALNINLQMVTAAQQAQTWHRINTSLLGDTVQLGFTMSDSQMRDTTFGSQFSEVELHGFVIDVEPSQVLA
jgi:hypothetical protein